ncbi:MAG: redoxin domain-containing protein [Balneola sp.]|jgi:thiol-disulfide isomerase/thioredoxin
MKKMVVVRMVVLVLITIGILGFTIYSKTLDSEKVRSRISELYRMELNDFYPSKKPKKKEINQPIIITYFHTDCSSCQTEIKDIQAHESLSQSAKIVLISDEYERVIKKFVQNFEVDTSKFRIILDDESVLKNHFGISLVPAAFVYGAGSLLVESFKGETKASTFYKLIK